MKKYYIENTFVWQHGGVTDEMGRAFRHIGEEFEAADDAAAIAIAEAWQEEDDALCAEAVDRAEAADPHSTARDADAWRPCYCQMLWRCAESEDDEDVQVEAP